jgi:hypothetical protein
MKHFISMVIALCFPIFAVAADAAQTKQANAVVSGMQAPVWIERSGTRQPLQAGASLLPGDRLSTGKDARVVLNMPDDSTVKLGEKVQFEIRELQPAQAGQPLRGFLRILTGAFRYTTNPSGKAKARQLDVQVGTATIGIRGTDVWGKSGPKQDLVCLIEGKIEISREGENPVLMKEALSVYTAAPKKPANPLSAVDMATVQTLALETELSQGQGVMRAGGAYGVFLYSETKEAKAKSRQQRLQKNGYAAEVYAVQLEGQPRYRVAIPNFASVEDARAAADKLKKLYRVKEVDVGEL